MEQKSLGNIVLVRATHQATMTGPEIRHVFGSRDLPYVWSNYFWLSLRRFSLILTKKKNIRAQRNTNFISISHDMLSNWDMFRPSLPDVEPGVEKLQKHKYIAKHWN